MPLATFLEARLDILRAAAASPAAVDEWNQPAYTADAIVATVDGHLQVLALREVGLLTDAGAQVGDFRAFLDAYHVTAGAQVATDIRASDRIRETVSGATYEVRAVLPTGPTDSAGHPHHYELLLRRVVD